MILSNSLSDCATAYADSAIIKLQGVPFGAGKYTIVGIFQAYAIPISINVPISFPTVDAIIKSQDLIDSVSALNAALRSSEVAFNFTSTSSLGLKYEILFSLSTLKMSCLASS